MNQKNFSARGLLWHYLQPLKGKVLLLTVLLFASIGLQLLAPQVVRHFLDLAQAGVMGAVLLQTAVLFFLTVTCQKIIILLTAYTSENLGWTATNRLRADLAEHVIKLDMGFHKQQTPGELIERVDGDITNLTEYFSALIIHMVGNSLLALGIILLLFREDWRVGLIGISYGSLVLLLLRLSDKYMVRFWGQVRQAFAQLYGFLEERMGGLEDIRANGAEGYVMLRLYPLLQATYRSEVRATVLGNLTFNFVFLLYVLSLLATLALGAWRFQQGLITIGTLYLLTYYVNQLERPFNAIRHHIANLQRAYASIGRIAEILHMQPQVQEQAFASAPRAAPVVSFNNVSFAYKDEANGSGQVDDSLPPVAVLQEISFRLEAGQTLGLLGRTGSGKTTMTRLLFRLYDVDRGGICLDDHDLRAFALSDLRQQVGIVTQDVQLFTATVRDNLTLFQNYNVNAPAISDEKIVTTLESLGLGRWLRALPNGLDTLLQGSQGLSAGEAQLFAFARVFLRDPKLVILDEASARLDPATEQLLELAIDRLLQGRTAIIIAHRLDTVQRADEILILENGRITENGRRQQLANNPNSRFYQLLQTGLEEVLV